MKTKEIFIDGIDRKILRVLYLRHTLVGSQIAKYICISCSAISPRLINLMKLGIIKPVKKSGLRVYKRNFGDHIKKIESYSRIAWDLNFGKSKKEV